MPKQNVDHVLVQPVDRWMKGPYILRMCRTPDRKRVVATWVLYSDINSRFPLDRGWEAPVTRLPAPYKICPIEGKGRGLIATRKIARNEIILRERPIIMAPRIMAGDPRSLWLPTEKILVQLLYWLEQEDRERFLQLHNSKSLDECGVLTGIFRTNTLAAIFSQSDVSTDYGAICLDASYANHSCVRNATRAFEEETMTIVVHASSDIAAGEEITISYINKCQTFAERQAQLQASYRFTCACPLCKKGPNRASDERRRFIASTIDNSQAMWMKFVNSPPQLRATRGRQDVKTMESVLRAMDEENIDERRLLAIQHIAFIYIVQDDVKSFRKWGEEALKLVEAELKINSRKNIETYSTWKEWVQNPTLLSMWLGYN